MKILITGGNGNIAKIIKNNLFKNINENNIFTSPGRDILNLLDFNIVKNFMKDKEFDICFHTSIYGGRRTKTEDYDVVYVNLLMFENLMKFSNKFKMIFNMDSGAIYDRKTDIINRKENEMDTIPEDFYGFSKYIIYKRSFNYNNLYNLRIFNIFHPNEDGIFFFDRDWWLFRHILSYLRSNVLPNELETLKELYAEASYYRLESLQRAIEDIPIDQISNHTPQISVTWPGLIDGNPNPLRRSRDNHVLDESMFQNLA